MGKKKSSKGLIASALVAVNIAILLLVTSVFTKTFFDYDLLDAIVFGNDMAMKIVVGITGVVAILGLVGFVVMLVKKGLK